MLLLVTDLLPYCYLLTSVLNVTTFPPTFRVILNFSRLSPTTQIPRSFQLCPTCVLHIFAVLKTFGQTSTTTPRLIPGLAHYGWVNKQFHSFQIQTLLIVNGNEDDISKREADDQRKRNGNVKISQNCCDNATNVIESKAGK